MTERLREVRLAESILGHDRDERSEEPVIGWLSITSCR